MTTDLRKQCQQFFRGEFFSDSKVQELLDNGDIVTEKDDLLRYLQTALYDDKIIELELDSLPRVYLTRVIDQPPDADEEEGDTIFEEIDYSAGDYLRAKSHILILPLEPALGNLQIRHARFVTLRVFTSGYAVELGTTYLEPVMVGKNPTQKLTFPSIGRIVRNAREFRAKFTESLDFSMTVQLRGSSDKMTPTPSDISFKGMAFTVSEKEQKILTMDSACSIKLFLNDKLYTDLEATVKHHSKVRRKGETEYVCGVEFDLITTELASTVESLVALVQRAYLKEINEKSDESGINLIA